MIELDRKAASSKPRPPTSWEAIVGHQLKTSLCAMLADIDTRTQVDAEDIGNNIQHMLRLIDQLQVAGLCQRSDGLTLVPASLKNTIHPVAARLAPLAIKRGQTIQLRDFSGGLKCLIEPTLAQEAASNLIENAIKYAPAHSRIVVGLTQAGKVHVIDDGRGIPVEEVEGLFEPFRRGSLNQQISGSGLGLSLVNQIMAGHGGSVSFRNRKNSRGAAFTLNFRHALRTRTIA